MNLRRIGPQSERNRRSLETEKEGAEEKGREARGLFARAWALPVRSRRRPEGEDCDEERLAQGAPGPQAVRGEQGQGELASESPWGKSEAKSSLNSSLETTPEGELCLKAR